MCVHTRERQTDRQTDRERDRERERQTDRQTERDRDTERDRHRERQTERDRDREMRKKRKRQRNLISQVLYKEERIRSFRCAILHWLINILFMVTLYCVLFTKYDKVFNIYIYMFTNYPVVTQQLQL